MKLSIVSVGTKMPAWVASGFDEYAKRLPKEFALKLTELPLASRAKTTSTAQVIEKESRQILATLPKNEYVVVLDVGGRSLSTEAFAEKLENWQMMGKDVSFVIGGPNGLSSECRDRADERWSLSALTLPHPLVRVVLAEQLYRAWSITQNHPYHK